jgi:eukaryotic-like serine/threonine-protein kinase
MTLERLKESLADRYTIEGELGAGGMATVYLAHDVRHDRKVALKVLRPELAAILGGDRFLAEIKTTANLQHPHILSLFDSGEADGLIYYVMPFVEGESVRDRLVREHQLPVEDAIRITREVADALEYAHGHGIVHRDIKPENILLHGGHAMVADFGIALAASRSEGGTRMTETGMSLGTPHYMAPEQAMGERDITPKADIYALGCVLYEMLTGEPPFTGPTAQAIIARVLTEQPRSLALQRHTIPPPLEAVVILALEKLPADRFATAAAFSEALANPASFALSSAATGMRAASAGPAPRDWRSRIALPALGGVVAMAALAAWIWLRPPPSGPVSRYRVGLPASAAPLFDFRGAVAVSPDGSALAYLGPSEAGQPYVGQLWMKRRDSDRAAPIPGAVPAVTATFSPDGRWIAFGAGTALKKVLIGGGAAITIADSVAGGITPAWLDDGTIVFEGGRSGVRRISAEGGSSTQVWPADSGAVRMLSPLPGARGVLLTRCSNAACTTGDLLVLNLRTGASRLAVAGAQAGWYLPTGHLLYVRGDGAALVVPFDLGTLEPHGTPVAVLDSVLLDQGTRPSLDVSRSGTLVMLRGAADRDVRYQLVWVDRNGREQPLAMDPVRLTALGNAGWAISPDGRRLAISLTGESGDAIFVKQLPSGPLSRVTFDSAAAAFRPRWTPGGRALTYVAGSINGALEVRRASADGTGSSALVASAPAGLFEAAVSPDGRWLVARTAGGVGRQGRDIVGYHMGDTTMVPLIANPSVDESAFMLSPDGRWIAYESDETGRREVYVRPFPNTDDGKWPASSDGGMAPLWARNGRELYFVDAQRRMMAMTFTAGTPPQLGEPRVLFTLAPEDYLDGNTYYTPFDVGPDGRFLIARRVRSTAEAPLIVVENWFTELKQKLQDR